MMVLVVAIEVEVVVVADIVVIVEFVVFSVIFLLLGVQNVYSFLFPLSSIIRFANQPRHCDGGVL